MLSKVIICSVCNTPELAPSEWEEEFDSEEDGAVTVRDRDTMQQERIKIADLKAYFEDKFRF